MVGLPLQQEAVVPSSNMMIFEIVVSPPRLHTSRTEEGNVIHGTVVAKQRCRCFDEILVQSQGNEHLAYHRGSSNETVHH
jgi:hypothetical protein